MSDRSPTSTTFPPPNDVSNALLVRWAFERINAKDVGSLRSFWTSDSTVHFPTGTCRGSDEIAVYFDQVFAAVSDFAFEIVAMAEAGNDVLVHWRLTGRHVGTFVGVAATGRRIEFEGFDISSSPTERSSPIRCATTKWSSPARSSCYRPTVRLRIAR